jgi:predicted MFS family arabinose efflux permease
VFRDHRIAALVVICLSVFVISVDATIVNVALPTLSRELDADTAQLQWIVDAYTLVIAGLLLSAGSLSDRYGRRGWLAGGLAVFAITSAVAAQVHSADALIAARAAMGVGAAVIFPTTLALITNIFTDPVPRANAIGVWAATHTRSRHRVPQRAPMLDVSVFANRRFSGGSLAVTAGFLTLFGFIFVITQYFQFIKSYSAFETGVRLLPVAVSIAVASVLGPRMVERIGTTAVVAAGLAIFAAGLGWASTVDAATPYVQIAMQMVLLGGGLGLTTAPATESIMGSLSADKAGVGSAVNDTTRELGGTLGVAIVGSVFASVYSGGIGSASAVAALPVDVRSTMERSTAAAYKVIGQLPAERIADVRDAVNHAFLHGLQIGALVCAAIALGAAVVVAGLLPAREGQTTSSMTQQPKAAPAVA